MKTLLSGIYNSICFRFIQRRRFLPCMVRGNSDSKNKKQLNYQNTNKT